MDHSDLQARMRAELAAAATEASLCRTAWIQAQQKLNVVTRRYAMFFGGKTCVRDVPAGESSEQSLGAAGGERAAPCSYEGQPLAGELAIRSAIADSAGGILLTCKQEAGMLEQVNAAKSPYADFT